MATIERPQFPVIPVVNKARTYRVASLSRPGTYHVVDLARDLCSCDRCKYHPAETELCRPKQWAVAFEQEQKELQEAMPIVAARLRSQVSGERVVPKVSGMTDEELKAVFA